MNLPLIGRLHWPSVIATLVFVWFVMPWLTGVVGGLRKGKSNA